MRPSPLRFVALLLVLVVGSVGCATKRLTTAVSNVPVELASPVQVRRPVDSTLQCFGDQLRAYNTVDDRDLLLEIDLIAEIAGLEGEKELPPDSAVYVMRAIDSIGRPLAAFRASSPAVAIRTPAGSILPAIPVERPRPPAAAYRVTGTILRATERSDRVDTRSASVLAGKGKGSTDGSIRFENRNTVTALTVSFNLEMPNGIMVRGTSATYRVPIERGEQSRSASLYVAGNGVGRDTRMTERQELGDALYDAIAMSLVQVLGRGLMVPYTRCNPQFSADAALDARVRESFVRLTGGHLEQYVKRFFYLQGFGMDLGSPVLTLSDRAQIAVEMQHRGLDMRDRLAWATLAEQLWHTLDYQTAATRISNRLNDTFRSGLEAAELEALADVRPEEFGWQPSERIVVLDLSAIKTPAAQRQLLRAARNCGGCRELRAHPLRPLYGVRVTSSHDVVQRAIRSTGLPLKLAWAGPTENYLRLTLK